MNKNTKNGLQTTVMTLFVICVLLACVWGMVWVAKTVSYKVFYEAKVQQTVSEMVKAEALNP